LVGGEKIKMDHQSRLSESGWPVFLYVREKILARKVIRQVATMPLSSPKGSPIGDVSLFEHEVLIKLCRNF
jgi:hypothetical protein